MSVAVAAVLGALLLVVVALMVWQEAKRRPTSTEITYGLEEAVEFVTRRLSPPVLAGLGETGVRRVLEWDLYYLQGLAQDDRRRPVDTVAGSYQPAVEFICERIATVHRVSYSEHDVRQVLTQQAAYLASIGAVGEKAGGQ